MRGKHGKAAQTRRDWAALELELDQARATAGRLESILNEETAKFEKQRAAFEREAAVLREAAEKVVAPALADERIRSAALRLERDAIKVKFDAWMESRRKLERALAVVISENFQIRLTESIQLIHETWAAVLDADNPGVIPPAEIFVVDAMAKKGSAKSIVRAVGLGRMSADQGDAVAAARNGHPLAERHGDETPYGRSWVSEASIKDVVAAAHSEEGR